MGRRSSGPPYSTTEIRQNLFTFSLVGPRLRRDGAQKVVTHSKLQKLERGETKGAEKT